jgi:TrmH family RNA methyltransferase
VSGLSRADEKLLTGLARRKVRESEGLFLAEGVRVVEELLATGVGVRMAAVSPSLEETARGRDLRRALADLDVVREVGPGALDALSETRTNQGVVAVAEIPRAGLGDLRAEDSTVVLVLDGVQDPGNLGTLARTGAAFGCGALLCLPGTVDPWNAKAVRASAGALFRFPVVSAGVEESLEWLAGGEIALLGADAAGEPVEDVPVPPRLALAVGNEGAGLGEAVRRGCDRVVSVPMRGGTESLNVAVATGILLYVITRGRA